MEFYLSLFLVVVRYFGDLLCPSVEKEFELSFLSVYLYRTFEYSSIIGAELTRTNFFAAPESIELFGVEGLASYGSFERQFVGL